MKLKVLEFKFPSDHVKNGQFICAKVDFLELQAGITLKQILKLPHD